MLVNEKALGWINFNWLVAEKNFTAIGKVAQ